MVNNGSCRSFQSHGGISIAEWLLLETPKTKLNLWYLYFWKPSYIYIYNI